MIHGQTTSSERDGAIKYGSAPLSERLSTGQPKPN